MRFVLLPGLGAAMTFSLLGATAQGQAPEEAVAVAPHTVADADWLMQPTDDDLAGVVLPYYERARAQVTLTCEVTEVGWLRRCAVSGKTPPLPSIAAAAQRLARRYMLRVHAAGADNVPTRVSVPLDLAACSEACLRSAMPDPGWLRGPTAEQMAAAFPQAARAAGIGGSVSLVCWYARERGLDKCRVEQETPKGQGFAAAARSLLPNFESPMIGLPGWPKKGLWIRIHFAFPVFLLQEPAKVTGLSNLKFSPSIIATDQAFPMAAASQGIAAGEGTVACVVAENGRLTACKIRSETPQNAGFGEAALSLAALTQVSVWGDEGVPTLGSVMQLNFPITAPKGPGDK
jgi:hypothetical protein